MAKRQFHLTPEQVKELGALGFRVVILQIYDSDMKKHRKRAKYSLDRAIPSQNICSPRKVLKNQRIFLNLEGFRLFA
jgi:hypothetical protein